MKTVRLDNVAHADLRIETGHGPAFGDAVNQVAVFVTEFSALQRHYPILFRRGDDQILHAFAILGLDRDENLFLSGAGEWTASYVPALLRRGPFLIGGATDGEPVIHVDLEHPRIAAGPHRGTPVFLNHGGHGPALEGAIEALQAIHVGHQAEAHFSALLDECSLVEPVRLEVALSDRDVVTFEDYLAVTADRIAALDGAALERLNKAGFLEAVIHAATSLATMTDLATRKLQRAPNR